MRKIAIVIFSILVLLAVIALYYMHMDKKSSIKLEMVNDVTKLNSEIAKWIKDM